MKAPLERLLSYVAVDTQSDPNAGCIPSTPGQFELARMVCGELEALGAIDGFDSREDIEVLPGEAADAVVVNLRICPVDSMEKLYLTVTGA